MRVIGWLAAGTVAAPLFTAALWAVRARSGGLGRVPGPDLASADQPAGTAVVALRGGAWINGVNVTWPFATLTVDESHAELRAPFTPPVTVNRSEVIELVWRRFPGRGLRFRTDSGRLDRVTFWPVPWRNAQERLARAGWS
jgi:hypothetical protein